MSFDRRIIGDCTLYCGDCLEVLPHLGTVDALITDPPFGIGRRKGTISKARNRNAYLSYDDTPENFTTLIVPRLKLALSLCKRAIVTPGTKRMFQCPAPTDVGMFYQPAACGMTHWGRMTVSPLLFYGRDPRCGKTIQPIHWQLTERAPKNGHPCPKPLGAVRWLVGRASLEGETVLAPFMGSGTTGVACAALGRRFVGIEIEPAYFEIACQRIEAAYQQPQLF